MTSTSFRPQLFTRMRQETLDAIEERSKDDLVSLLLTVAGSGNRTGLLGENAETQEACQGGGKRSESRGARRLISGIELRAAAVFVVGCPSCCMSP